MANMSWSKVTGAKRNAATKKAGHTPRFKLQTNPIVYGGVRIFLSDFHRMMPEDTPRFT